MVEQTQAAPVVAVVSFGAVEDESCLEQYFGGNCHLVVEYSGYTWDHLPKKFDASLAILAARMAFSNRPIRSPVR